MTSRDITCAALLLVVTVAGCGSSATPAANRSTTATTSTTSITPSLSPTPSYSTETEIASVIAGGEKTWRDVDEKKFDCRLALVQHDDGFAASTDRFICYSNETTAGLKAQTALRDLTALTIPPSMVGLVADTKAALQSVVDSHLEESCGEDMLEAKVTEECTSALGARSMSYTRLSSALDKWAPYL